MAQQDKLTYEGTFNHASTGLFKDNTTGEIEAVDHRAQVTNTKDSVPFTLDDSYTWPFPQVTASGTDTYTATLSPAITAYAAGQKFQLLFTNANTGASTLALNGLAALAVTKNGATALVAGDIPVGSIKILVYDGTRLQIIGDGSSSGAGAVDSVNGATGVVVLDAGDIGVTPTGAISATDVQAALAELDSEKATTGSVSTVASDLATHIADSSAAHAASAISFSATGGISATDVQAAIAELDSEKVTAAILATTITNGDTTHAPDGNAVFDALALKADLTAVIGVQDLPVSAVAMWPRVTGGCASLAQFEMPTSLFNIQGLAFDQTTQEFAQFQTVIPKKWDKGTVTVTVYWTAIAGSGTVQWGISGGAYSDDDALTVALGTPQTSDDTLLATNDLHISPATAAITLAGTPADADFLAFQISRNPASDTLTGDAILLGIMIHLTTDAAIDA